MPQICQTKLSCLLSWCICDTLWFLQFLFGDIVAGSYEITVNKSGYKPYSNRVTVVDTIATADAVLEKEDAQTISGTVLNKETNQPVSNVQLTTVPVTISVISDNNGVYQFAKN